MSAINGSKAWFNVSMPHEPNLKPLDPQSYENSAKLRLSLNGDRQLYLAHFREAFNHDNDVLQIALALAFGAMTQANGWGRNCADSTFKKANCTYKQINAWYVQMYTEAFPSVRFSALIIQDFCDGALKVAEEAGFVEAILARQFYMLEMRNEKIHLIDPQSYQNSAALRLFLKGERELYQAHFREAFQQDNFVLQIAISIAFNKIAEDKNEEMELLNTNHSKKFTNQDIKKWYVQMYTEAFPRMQALQPLIANFAEEAVKAAVAAEFVEAVCSMQ